MRPDPRTEGRRWLDRALRDLDDARYAANGERHNLACFLSQHAAEKALKGSLVLHGRATADAFSGEDSERAIGRAEKIIRAVEGAFE